MDERQDDDTPTTDREQATSETTEIDGGGRLARLLASVRDLLTGIAGRDGRRDEQTGEQEPLGRVGDGPPAEQTDHSLLAVDPELLDPEQRIVQLLLSEGGRIPQSEIVERTRWTSSTVSRRLGNMESRGLVERRRFTDGKTVFLVDESVDPSLERD
ncbi:helix-turn-helix transcriptional regulator [Salinirubrum litoreum]|uniref:Helix-turn-helix transcriptional regulator n=1 Tax=Salinirubrum litoreum TaxID=1126234 RepID=A0ABD5RC12_9EURY|nr:MarR family transcriptional regulator [Salinirubrum litoreum]